MTPQEILDSRPYEIVSDAISGVKEQVLYTANLKTSNSACLALKIYINIRRRGATIRDVARVS